MSTDCWHEQTEDLTRTQKGKLHLDTSTCKAIALPSRLRNHDALCLLLMELECTAGGSMSSKSRRQQASERGRQAQLVHPEGMRPNHDILTDGAGHLHQRAAT